MWTLKRKKVYSFSLWIIGKSIDPTHFMSLFPINISIACLYLLMTAYAFSFLLLYSPIHLAYIPYLKCTVLTSGVSMWLGELLSGWYGYHQAYCWLCWGRNYWGYLYWDTCSATCSKINKISSNWWMPATGLSFLPIWKSHICSTFIAWLALFIWDAFGLLSSHIFTLYSKMRFVLVLQSKGTATMLINIITNESLHSRMKVATINGLIYWDINAIFL